MTFETTTKRQREPMMRVATAGFIILMLGMLPASALAEATLNACVNNASGTIRVLPAGSDKCNNNETLVQLSQGGQTAEPGTQVVDSQGNLVGRLIDGDEVLRQINGVWVSLPINEAGFKSGSFGSSAYPGALLYTTPNCSGQAYLVNQDLVAKPGRIDSGILYFATTPPQRITVLSQASGGVCSPSVIPVSPSASPVDQMVDLSTLGLVPPFSLQ